MLLKARVEANHIIQVSHNILGIQHLQHALDHCLERSWGPSKLKRQPTILKQTKWRHKSRLVPAFSSHLNLMVARDHVNCSENLCIS